MKKSFMTRVLATGLSLAMAFSLSAATNVTTAAAASKPAMITYQGGGSAKTLSVKLGEATKIKVNAATKKTYKVSAAKRSSNKLRVAVNKAGTVVTIRGLKPTEEGKPAAVKVSFKVRKTGKTSKYSYASKVNVIEDKLTMTAEATHANEIVATFNKAVGSDTKITLKKKNASDVANTVKIAEDGKSATITLTGKLTDGTYTVTAVAGDDTLTADVVAKTEVLTSFEIGTTLKETESAAQSVSREATAIISYKALNQYGDKINYSADMKSVTVSIGQVTEVTACKTSAAGTIKVEKIPAMYAINGQSFTFVIVDTVNNTGVTLNKTAVYGPSATPKTFKAAGLYNIAKSTFKDIAEDDKIADYALLFTCEDQYGDDMSSEDVAKLASAGAVQVTVAGGLTNIKASDAYKNYTDGKNYREVKDVTYFAVPLEGMQGAKANAGEFTVTIVNNTQGVVYNEKFTVTSGTVISSIDISAADTIYAEQENKLNYTVTDSEGKTITDYATLNTIKFENVSKDDEYTWKKNADGSTDLIYTPAEVTSNAAVKFKNSELRSCTIQANKAISGKMLVYPKTFTVYYKRIPFNVTGLASTATRVSENGNDITLAPKDLVVLDQYSNPLTMDAKKGADIYVTSGSALTASSAAIVTSAAVTSGIVSGQAVTAGAMGAKLLIKGLTSAEGNKSIKLKFFVSSAALTAAKAEDSGYAATFSYGDTKSVSGLNVASVNSGCMLHADGLTSKAYLIKGTDTGAVATSGAMNTAEACVVVKGLIDGRSVTIPTKDWQFVGAEKDGRLPIAGVKSYSQSGEIITETREFSIVVDTADGAQTITGSVQVSNAPSVGTSISAKDDSVDATVATDAAYEYVSADALFKVTDQYNQIVSGSELVTYTVQKVAVSGDAVTFNDENYAHGATIPVSVIEAFQPGTNNASLKISGGLSKANNASSGALVAKVKVTAQASKDSAKTASKDITINFEY